MTRLVRALMLIALVTTTTLAVSAGPAAACTCAGPRSDAENLADADVVFVGTPQVIHDARGDGDGSAVIEFNVDGVYKGEVTTPFVIVTHTNEAACGYSFRVGEETLVVARDEPDLEEGFVLADLCSGTRPVSDGEVMLDIEPSAPLEADGVDMGKIQRQLGDPRPDLIPEAIIGVSVLAFVLGLVAWLNRKGRTVNT